jgi:GNAT superfamily N-acetyltransferase
MNPRVRTAVAGDIPEMHRIRMAVRENRLTDPDSITEAAYRPFVEAGRAWVAEQGDGMAGFAAIDGAAREVWALFVAPGAEGLGVGRALHAAMIEWARTGGLTELWLATSAGTRAERFYRAAGWERAGAAADGDIRLRRSIAVDAP